MALKIQTFLALGGSLNLLRVTEQYAGEEYHRYNSADRVKGIRCASCSRGVPRELKAGLWRHGKWMCANQNNGKPQCVLVHRSIWEEAA